MNSEPRTRAVSPLRGGFGCRRLVAIACLLAAAGCGDDYDDGLSKFPVTGTVLVDGEPAEGVVVRFFRDGKPGTTNADTPLGVTDAEGTFQLSTNAENDGAVPGDYRVTFTWKNGNSPVAVDRLGGRYTRLDQSNFNVTVRAEDNQLEPFSLESSTAGEKTTAKPARGRAPNPNAPASGPAQR